MSFDFSGLVKDPRDVPAPEGSTNAQLLALPRQRQHTHDLKGKLLYFPRTDQVMVPFEYKGDGWNVVVVHNGPRSPKHDGTNGWRKGTPVYPPSGYSLYVSCLEMQTAIELEPSDAFEVEVTTSSGLTHAFPADDLEAARQIVRNNEPHGNTSEIYQSVTFRPEVGWTVPAYPGP